MTKQEIKKQLNSYKVHLAETLTGHWYEVTKHYDNGRHRKLGYFASSTTILNAYPQSQHLTKWIAEQGWQESQRIKTAAGVRGTNVHNAIEDLLNGIILDRRNYSLEEWHKIFTFTEWHEEYQPEVILMEVPVFSQKYKYAGRFDLLAKMNDKIYVIDWKTSSGIHPHFPLQFASYAHALEETTGMVVDYTAAVQLGARNKQGYRFVEYPRDDVDVKKSWVKQFEIFKTVQKTWIYDNGSSATAPPVLELPKLLKLN